MPAEIVRKDKQTKRPPFFRHKKRGERRGHTKQPPAQATQGEELELTPQRLEKDPWLAGEKNQRSIRYFRLSEQDKAKLRDGDHFDIEVAGHKILRGAKRKDGRTIIIVYARLSQATRQNIETEKEIGNLMSAAH